MYQLVLVFLSMVVIAYPSRQILSQNIDSIYTLDKMQRSSSFAQMTIGADMLMLNRPSLNINGSTVALPGVIVPRISIGGTHFWGHADFYVQFPMGIVKSLHPNPLRSFGYFESVETGAKIYPWAISTSRLRPYIGCSFQPLAFGATVEPHSYNYSGSTYRKIATPLHMGLSYASAKYIWHLGVRWNKDIGIKYSIQPDRIIDVRLSRLNFNFSFLRYFNTNRNMGTPRIIDQLNVKTYILKKEKAMNVWYWALGPSTAIQMSKSSFFKNQIPFFYEDMNNSALVPEIAIGRYFYRWDANINITGRYMTWQKTAFDAKVDLTRRSLAFEIHKYLLDYHGFTPFVGPSVMWDRLTFSDDKVAKNKVNVSVGIVFGWDIRLSSVETWLLRTNLRYNPGHNINIGEDKVMFDHLEFNFIQYVHFIGRKSIFKKYRK